MRRSRLRIVTTLALALHVGGCVKWTPVRLRPPYPSQEELKRFRVTSATVTEFRVRDARFENDSIVGKPQGAETRVSFLISEVSTAEVGKISWLRTVALAATPVVILSILYSAGTRTDNIFPEGN